MDLELAAIAGAGIDVANAERAAEHVADAYCSASRKRRESSPSGGGSVTIPTEQIWRRVLSMSEIVSAVGRG